MTRPTHGLTMLAIARLIFGSLVLLRTTPLLGFFRVPYLDAGAPLLGGPLGWRIAAFGIALPHAAVAAVHIARTLGVLLFTIGVRTTPAGVAASLLGYVALSQNVLGYVNTLNLLFLGLMVLAVSGSGSRLALRPEPEIDPVSGVLLVRSLVVSVYAWSGVAKLNSSWLGGDVLAQLHDNGVVRGAFADCMLAPALGRMLVAWTVAATELALGPALLWRRTRIAAVVVAFVLHAVLEAAVHPDFFGFAMAALLLSFVEPPARRITDKVHST